MPAKIPIEELKKVKFGKLTVLKEVLPNIMSNGKTDRRLLCQCDCGKQTITLLRSIRHKKTFSCGCYLTERRLKHNQSYTRLYGIWLGIKRRCNNPLNQAYRYYGGRAIKICNEWNESIHKFTEWAMENGYNDNLTIDRIDGSGNYEPLNCRWVTMRENCRNKKTTKLNMEIAREIRNAFLLGCFTKREIARAYNIGDDHVGYIINNRLWKET